MFRVILFSICAFMMSCKSSNSTQVKSDEMKKEMPKTAEIVEEVVEQKETSFKDSNGNDVKIIYKSDDEWKKQLDDKEYYVIREKGTERSFTSSLLQNKKDGIYTCKACDFPLFKSDTKYKSGTGWPSFFQPIDDAHILEDTDYDLGYARTEVMCRRCEGHLGHVFKDGPQPTGLRYCINGVSLSFEGK